MDDCCMEAQKGNDCHCECVTEINRLRSLLNDIEMLTATGEGLTPDECMRVHLMANVREKPEAGEYDFSNF